MNRTRKLTDEQVREIRAAIEQRKRLTNKWLAHKYGVSLSVISSIVRWAPGDRDAQP